MNRLLQLSARNLAQPLSAGAALSGPASGNIACGVVAAIRAAGGPAARLIQVGQHRPISVSSFCRKQQSGSGRDSSSSSSSERGEKNRKSLMDMANETLENVGLKKPRSKSGGASGTSASSRGAAERDDTPPRLDSGGRLSTNRSPTSIATERNAQSDKSSKSTRGQSSAVDQSPNRTNNSSNGGSGGCITGVGSSHRSTDGISHDSTNVMGASGAAPETGGLDGSRYSKSDHSGKTGNAGVGGGVKTRSGKTGGAGKTGGSGSAGYYSSGSRSGSDHRVTGPVRHDKKAKRFVLDLGNNQVARIDYKEAGDGRVELYHTEVPEEMRGRGIGRALARGALEAASKANLKLKVTCDYLQDYVKRFADDHHRKLVES